MAIAKNQNAQYAYNYLKQKYGYSDAQAAGIVGNLMQESSLNTGARNRGDGRDGSDSFGIGQWNQDRAVNLHRFAKASDRDVYNLDTQLDFIHHELNGVEKRSGDLLRNATDIPSATRAMISYERPQYFKWDNPTAGHGYSNRERYAAEAVKSFGGDDGAQIVASYQPTQSNTPAQTATATIPATTPDPNIDPRMLDKNGKEITGLAGFGRGIRNGIDDALGVKNTEDGTRQLWGFNLDGEDSISNGLGGFATALAAADSTPTIAPLQGGRTGGSTPIQIQFSESLVNSDDDDPRKRRGALAGFGGFTRRA